MSLALFIAIRSRNHPENFALTELDHSGRTRPSPPVDGRLSNVKVLLSNDFEFGEEAMVVNVRNEVIGQIDKDMDLPSSYGCLWDARGTDRDDGQTWERDGLASGLVAGMQILQIQRGKYHFLVQCCEKILHDVDPTQLKTSAIPKSEEDPLLLGHDAYCSNFIEAAKRAAYVSGRRLNIDRITRLAAAALQSAKDHLVGLREDPEYFAEAVILYQEHMCGKRVIPKASGSKVATLVMQGHITLVLLMSYNNVMYLEPAHAGISRLDEIRNSKDLPEDYPEMFSGLVVSRYMLEGLADILSKFVGDMAGSQSTFEPYVQRDRLGPDHRSSGYDGCGYSGNSDGKLRADPIGVTVYNLLCRIAQQPLHLEGVYTLLDHLESYCLREPDAREWISSLLQSTLTTLSVVVECLVLLRASFPKLKNGCTTMAATAAMEAFQESMAGWDVLLDTGFKDVISVMPGDPSDGKFAYPSQDTRTKANVEARRKAERNLDNFWRNVDKSFKRYSGEAQQKSIRKTLNEAGPLRRTAPRSEIADGKGLQEQEQEKAYKYVPFSEVFHDLTKEITGNFNRLAVGTKSKDKTRGIATVQADNDSSSKGTSNEAAPKPQYRIDKSSLPTIRALFYSKNDGELPRSIRFTDLVSTLTKLGFSAEKLQGSIWRFTPKKIDQSRAIEFHEPHPGKSYTYENACETITTFVQICRW